LAQGYFDAALQEADQGYRKTEKRDRLWSWKFRILKAEVGLRRGDLRQTVDLLSPEPPSQLPVELIVRRKIDLGEAFCRLNRPQDSETVLRDAEQLIQSTLPGLQAELALTRGRCSLSRNRATALRYFESASTLAMGGDKSVEAIALLNAGWVLFQEQNCGDAITQLSRALTITDSPLIREKTFGNLAECYADLGDWRQSISFAHEAESLADRIKNIGDQKVWLIDLGRAHLVLREYSEAEPYYDKALAIAKRLNDTDATWRCLNNLTQLALRRHDLTAAERSWKEESALNLGAEGRTYATFDAAMIAVEQKGYAKAEPLFKEILNSKPRDSLRLLTERELGNVYWEEGRITDAGETFRGAIDDAEAVMKRLPPQYRMAFLDVDVFYDSYVRFLAAQGRILDSLKIAERGRAQILSQAGSDSRAGQGFDLKAVQVVLRKRGQIALAYSLTDDESFLWVITPTQLKMFHLPSHKTLRPLIDAYKNEVVGPPRSITDSRGSQELYKTLIQPAENLIPKRSHAVIISSKILSLVNFEALIVPGAPGARPHYWIDDVEIETASSLALLAHPRLVDARSAQKKKELLLLGAPLEADKDFPALQNASDEMNRVRSHFSASQETVISGKDAIPQSYRASNPGHYRFIHIDAHSAASELNPLKSFVVLSPTADHSYKLFADEITETPLRADLVTLSACYGAGTRWYQGEGIVGLGWAFLRAGAHQVVASLWTVDDASTPQLMDDFYNELSKGKSAAEALRTAKLKMLHADGPKSRPFYWASLQLYTGS